MPLIVAAFCLLWLGVGSLAAQQTPDPRIDQIRRLSDPAAMTDARAKELTETTLSLVMDQIWTLKELEHYRPAKRPPIEVVIEGRRRPPFVKNGGIVFSVDYFELATELLTLLGHDVYVSQGGRLTYPRPLLTHPFAVSPILPQLDPLVLYVQNSFFSGIRDMLACQQAPDCAYSQQLEFEATLFFVLLHELGHLRLGHGPRDGDTYPLEQEEQADRNAWDGLQSLLGGTARDRQDRTAALAFAAAPVLILEFERSTQTGANQNAIAQREQTLLGLLPPEVASSVTHLVKTNPREETPIGSVIVHATDMPELLIIDGIPVPHQEILDRPFLLAGGVHELMAVAPGRLACQELAIIDSSTLRCSILFAPLMPGIPRVAELQALADKRDWFQILLRTSDTGLHLKAPSLGFYHWKALHELSLDNWIQLDPRTELSDDETGDLEYWMRRRAPLARWH